MTETTAQPAEENPCVACGLWQTTSLQRPSQPRGSEEPKLLLIGEAPGPEEDKAGFFFVGPSGAKLDDYLNRLGIEQSLVRFENIVRCMPKKEDGNTRTPEIEEMEWCCGYLFNEIARLDPELLMVFGNTALNVFTGKTAITKARGRTYEWTHPVTKKVYKVLPTIHPAAVVRGNLQYEVSILADLAYAKELLFGREEKVVYTMLNSLPEIDMVLGEIEAAVEAGDISYVAVDTETTGLNAWAEGARLLCYSISVKDAEAYLIPVSYSMGPFANDMLAQEGVKSRMRTFLQKVPVTGQNIKFDIKWSRRHANADMPNIVFDTMLASWALHSDSVPHDLESLAASFVGMYAAKQEMAEALAALPKDKRMMDYVKPEVFVPYACRDADATFRLTTLFKRQLEEAGLMDSFKLLLLEMVVPFSDIEFDGVKFNPDPVEVARTEYEEKAKKIPELMKNYGFDPLFQQKLKEKGKLWMDEAVAKENLKAQKEARNPRKVKMSKKFEPHNLSISSASDMAILFYEVFNLPVKNKTAKGAPSTDKDTVIELIKDVVGWSEMNEGWRSVLDFMKTYQEIKKDQKLYSSYLVKLPKFVDENSMIHTSYNIGATATGRFSSSDPSLHTLPWKSTAKKAFISRFENGLIAAADYSQIEMRIMAIFSGDQQLLQVFRDGGDVHLANASRLYKKPPEQITVEERRKTKIASFGILYGQGAQGLAEQHHIPEQEAKDLIEAFYAEFPTIKDYIDKQQAYVKQYKCSFSAFGRRRIIPEAMSHNRGDLSKADRIAVNNPIQGTASEMTALALKRIYWSLRNANMNSKVFGFVHDEIALDIYPKELFASWKIMSLEMGDVPPKLYEWLSIPLKYSFEIGASWGHKIDVEPDFVSERSFKVSGEPENVDYLAEFMSKWEEPFVCVESMDETYPDGRPVRKAQFVLTP